ncbi:TPA: hypothetical protein ACYSBI_001850 [Morganella morganii]
MHKIDRRILNFFGSSDMFDRMVTRQLSHIKGNWELTWNNQEDKFDLEENSYAEIINNLLAELSMLEPPGCYHDNEDQLAEYCKESLNWPIYKVGKFWRGMEYVSILEQGGFSDECQTNLCLSITGRLTAAINRNQLHFDDMERSHQNILANVIAIILYHRSE